MSVSPVGIGLAGAGAFGEFCLAAFAEVPQVRIAAVCDTDTERVHKYALQYGVPAYTELDAMLADPAVEIVALNTPPAFHAGQGLAALHAGKHLFCEKPLAMTLAEGEALRVASVQAGKKITIDYVMRHNPLWQAAVAVRASGILGRLLHMDLANHAAGLNLPASHWFWDKSKSGGIWIEHGVHFFDVLAWVAGTNGTVTSAQAFTNAAGQEDRVEALAQYGDIAAHFYHGFTHSGRTERTRAELTFEHGFLTLEEWVPTELVITTEQATSLATLLPGSVTAEPLSDGQIRIRARLVEGKSAVYRACIQSGIRDLAHSIRNPGNDPAVTLQHGIESLRMAVEAESLGRHTPV
ncbi:MAG: Gfo/Idh/MocA family oxidoreductase [Pleurocapsa minor GSE-CHR-MK-17-07R]|jgi:predicted dehydrogenase|nr:Gfo/Idh/MocA family oxidoreductase [Pleurocapsa minor GSE-CHR-MK 17-07R]